MTIILKLTRHGYVEIWGKSKRLPAHVFEPATIRLVGLPPGLTIETPLVRIFSDTFLETEYSWRFHCRSEDDYDFYCNQKYIQTFCRLFTLRLGIQAMDINQSKYGIF